MRRTISFVAVLVLVNSLMSVLNTAIDYNGCELTDTRENKTYFYPNTGALRRYFVHVWALMMFITARNEVGAR